METITHNTWEHSADVDALFEALVAANTVTEFIVGEVPATADAETLASLERVQLVLSNITVSKVGNIAGKDGKPGYKYEYVPLNEVIDAVRPVLARHGLVVMQVPTTPGRGQIAVTTIVGHSSGQWIAGTLTLDAGNGAQSQGAAITYARRYGLMAMLGIFNEEDDGGASAQAAVDRQQRQNEARERGEARRSQPTGQNRGGGGRGSRQEAPARAQGAEGANEGESAAGRSHSKPSSSVVESFREAAAAAGVNEARLIVMARGVQRAAGVTESVRTVADLGREDVFARDQHLALAEAIEAAAHPV